MIIVLDERRLRSAQSLFGRPIELYGNVVSATIGRAAKATYRSQTDLATIDDVPTWNRELCQEVLEASHLSALTSIVRASRWFEATWREYESDNFLGFASCARSLLEAVGDAAFSLHAVARTLLEHQSSLRTFLSGRADAVLGLGEVEEVLIHFAHARRLTKSERETLPPVHAAKATTTYVEFLESTGVTGAMTLYAELCQLGHPARSSMEYLYSEHDRRLVVRPEADRDALDGMRTRYCALFADLPSIAFNPGLLILKALHRFDGFPKIPELRKFEFQGALAGQQVAALMRE